MEFECKERTPRLEFLRPPRPPLGMLVAAHKTPLYRITLVDKAWHVRRPRATLDHAFASLEEATSFVLSDSDGAAEFVELVADNTYMVKKLGRA